MTRPVSTLAPWLCAGALALALVPTVWLYRETQRQSLALGQLASAHEATLATLGTLQTVQARQGEALATWQAERATLAQQVATQKRALREAKDATYRVWADQPLPLDAVRVFTTGPAPR